MRARPRGQPAVVVERERRAMRARARATAARCLTTNPWLCVAKSGFWQLFPVSYGYESRSARRSSTKRLVAVFALPQKVQTSCQNSDSATYRSAIRCALQERDLIHTAGAQSGAHRALDPPLNERSRESLVSKNVRTRVCGIAEAERHAEHDPPARRTRRASSESDGCAPSEPLQGSGRGRRAIHRAVCAKQEVRTFVSRETSRRVAGMVSWKRMH